MKAFFSFFDFIPGWVWALLFAGAIGHGCVATGQRDSARVKLAETKVEVKTLEAAIADGKAKASARQAELTAKVLEAERKLNTAALAQEKKDAQNKSQVRDLSAQLRDAAGPGNRLRDPFAEGGCGRGGGSPQDPTPRNSLASEGDGAQGGGLLSAQFTEFIERTFAEADQINVAYRSCKEALVQDRAPP